MAVVVTVSTVVMTAHKTNLTIVIHESRQVSYTR